MFKTYNTTHQSVKSITFTLVTIAVTTTAAHRQACITIRFASEYVASTKIRLLVHRVSVLTFALFIVVTILTIAFVWTYILSYR